MGGRLVGFVGVEIGGETGEGGGRGGDESG